jgi:hypothetical protein
MKRKIHMDFYIIDNKVVAQCARIEVAKKNAFKIRPSRPDVIENTCSKNVHF